MKMIKLALSGRGALVHQLLKHADEASSQAEEVDDHHRRSCSSSPLLPASKHDLVKAVLLRLKATCLRKLLSAVRTRGADPGGCVHVPLVPNSANHVAPHVLLAQVFRWPDLNAEALMQRLPVCEAGSRMLPQALSEKCHNHAGFNNRPRLYECCNPYHWSRLVNHVTNPPIIPHIVESEENTLARRLLHHTDSDPSMIISYATNGTEDNCDLAGHRTWCKLAYWEEGDRVGKLFPVSASTVEVYAALPKGEGLCLASLYDQNARPSPKTTKTREKIGQGLLLWTEENGVWVYNRTETPIFVNSPTLEPPPLTETASSSSTNPYAVIKVLPGYSIQVFDYEKSVLYERLRDPRSLDGPFDPHSIRISFVKGWGGKYSRQVVNSCPCWLEILLTVPPHR